MGAGFSGGSDIASSFGTGAAGATGGSSAGGSIGSKIASSIFGGAPTDTVNQIAGIVPSVAPLAYEAIAGQQPPKGTNALNSEATQLQAQGQQTANYLSTGTLPPGVQSALTSASDSAKAAIRSKYASLGDSGGSAEVQDLANVDALMAGQGANIAMQLYQQGVSEEQTAAQLQEGLLNNTIQQDAQFTQALGTFAAALAGGGQTLQIKTG